MSSIITSRLYDYLVDLEGRDYYATVYYGYITGAITEAVKDLRDGNLKPYTKENADVIDRYIRENLI